MSDRNCGLILPLPRPEYFGGPEAMLTGIAWDAAGIQLPPSESGQKVGLAYVIAGQAGRSANLTLRPTYPSDPAGSWLSALVAAGIEDADDRTAVAIADALKGVRPEKGYTIPASPVTTHTALLQNASGLARKANPFNVATMIEMVYALGRPSNAEPSTVAGTWLAAMAQRTAANPLLSTIDRAIKSDRLGFVQADHEWTPQGAPSHEWGDLLCGQTPFGWFYRAWSSLTSAWADRLPPRVWVDWATGILRLALGFSYLWESAFYERLARLALVGELPDDPAILVRSVKETMPWRSRYESTSIRDVVSPMKGRIGRGNAVRDVLKDVSVRPEPGAALEDVREFAASPGGRQALEIALAGDSTKNVWEAVRYALASRSDAGTQADFYGMLRNAGTRYAVVEPGTEWTAMIAGITTGQPLRECTAGDVRFELASLGVHPDLQELVLLLEEAGLARGSADADQAVVVQAPY